MYIRKLIPRLLIMVAPIVFLTACGGGGGSSAVSKKTSLSGTVTTLTANAPAATPTPATAATAPAAPKFSPLAGVTVTAGGKSVVTDELGRYALNEIKGNSKLNVRTSHPDFFPKNMQIDLPTGESVTANLQLAAVTNVEGFDSTFGAIYPVAIETAQGTTPASATFFGTTVTLPANAYVLAGTKNVYDGPVIFKSRYFNAQDFAQATTLPNSYSIKNPKTADSLFQSFGAQSIFLETEQGEPLDLAAGKKIVIELPSNDAVPEGQTMKMWHFDEKAGEWQYEDDAIIKNNRYRAVVSHTGFVSLGVASAATGKVTGCVTNSKNEPQQYARAELFGANWGASGLSTDNEGKFDITAIAGVPFVVRASKSGIENGFDSQYTVAAGETLDLSNPCIILPSPAAKFTVSWGPEPRDLDAHVIFTRAATIAATPATETTEATEESEGFETNDVSFGNSIVDDVVLSADAAAGLGPETIDISALTDGEYILTVQHFNGLSNMSADQDQPTTATLNITGQELRTLTAPEGGSGVNDVWTVWKIKVEAGSIAVTEINKIAKKVSAKTASPSIDISVKGITQN